MQVEVDVHGCPREQLVYGRSSIVRIRGAEVAQIQVVTAKIMGHCRCYYVFSTVRPVCSSGCLFSLISVFLCALCLIYVKCEKSHFCVTLGCLDMPPSQAHGPHVNGFLFENILILEFLALSVLCAIVIIVWCAGSDWAM